MISADAISRARLVPIASLVAGWKLRRVGAELVGPCPMCGLGNDRLQINTRKNVFFCRQCNPKGGGPIDFAMWVHRCDFPRAIEILTGAQPNVVQDHIKPPPAEQTDQKRLALARRLWKQSVLAYDTACEDYLRARGYVGRIPHTVRYLAPNGDYPPSMIAAIRLAHARPGRIHPRHSSRLSQSTGMPIRPARRARAG